MSENNYEAAFFIIPRYIRKLPGLTLAYLDVFEYLFQFWNRGQQCYLKNKTIMEKTGIESESTIREAFMFFEKQGVMKRVQSGRKRYLVLITPDIEHEAGENSENNSNENNPVDNSSQNSSNYFHGVDAATGGRRATDGLPVDESTHINNKLISKKLKKSFYKDSEQKKANAKKHPWAAMKNEAASIKRSKKHKHLDCKRTMSSYPPLEG
jgi:hypothetical protein